MTGTVSLNISIIIFILIMRGQYRGMQTPIKKSGMTILLPILYISTSLLQLLDPNVHVSGVQVILAIASGLILAIPLILSTNYETRENGKTYIKRNKKIFVLLLIIFVLRFLFVANASAIDSSSLGLICNLVTLGYIVFWRSMSFIKFRKEVQQPVF